MARKITSTETETEKTVNTSGDMEKASELLAALNTINTVAQKPETDNSDPCIETISVPKETYEKLVAEANMCVKYKAAVEKLVNSMAQQYAQQLYREVLEDNK